MVAVYLHVISHHQGIKASKVLALRVDVLRKQGSRDAWRRCHVATFSRRVRHVIVLTYTVISGRRS
jgi:hypothetical protein